MKALIVTHGTRGDVQPYAALALALPEVLNRVSCLPITLMLRAFSGAADAVRTRLGLPRRCGRHDILRRPVVLGHPDARRPRRPAASDAAVPDCRRARRRPGPGRHRPAHGPRRRGERIRTENGAAQAASILETL
ncbi:hypothetical protein Ppa06_59580 [Planomonospora parontospora subsp. parontospora]|uniref:Glycosyltransferase family 28 N-terminal domain-containing protein n=2 Tax=Planomonospora parontospora TaxID=58119 RepID=A0AA37BM65_9ACTN|nr:hypothetical protein [Planomonospora parontospora]GGK92139.1 hypothetical protein GCM10010126_59370 [Planomonospora parontospora]GII12160.1 hypothetical protein Ppa06_59580 [Planomonospora parontospora subsp. parontospora]